MAITALAVSVDKEEYSQFEQDNGTITVTVYPTPVTGLNGEEIQIDLIKARRGRDSSIYTETYTFGSSDYTNGVQFSIVLENVRSSPDLLRLARRGRYFVRATDVNATTTYGDSSDFDIRLITANRLESRYLTGLNLSAFERRMPIVPFRELTGVQVLRTSVNHPPGFYDLTYRVASAGEKFLTWARGPEVKLAQNISPQKYVLRGNRPGSDYMVVMVTYPSLPASSVVEEVVLDTQPIDETVFREFIDGASDQVENSLLQIFLEPTKVTTDIDPSTIAFSEATTNPILLDFDYDYIGIPVAFYPAVSNQWHRINFPYIPLLRVDQLFGVMANTRIMDINLEWLSIDEPSGFTSLVPYHQESVFDMLGLPWCESIRGYAALPEFWHYMLVAGLRDLPKDLQELVAKLAAIDILNIAGAAYMGGIASQSLSKDGFSQSISYTRSAQVGTFGSLALQYQNWVSENLLRFRKTYRGLAVSVI